ncbi:MAG: Autotransporter beta-domain protein [Gammaproteobacteria bacterium]|nr:Autotransporter beta-domain protein [Gammaproteobacteria bacterium]
MNLYQSTRIVCLCLALTITLPPCRALSQASNRARSVSATHIEIGDSLAFVQHALVASDPQAHVASVDQPVNGQIRLGDRGIWVFFDDMNHVRQYRFDAPFGGDIHGARIGASMEQIHGVLGSAVKEFPLAPGTTAYLYRIDSATTIQCEFVNQKLQTIRLLSGFANFSEFNTNDGAVSGLRQQATTAGAQQNDVPNTSIPGASSAPLLNMDHSATFKEPTTPIILDLGRLSGGGNSSYASAISADGTVVVGSANHGNYGQVAFKWKPDTGMVSLDQSFFIRHSAYATAVNYNGSVIVGAWDSAGSGLDRAFRWTKETGMFTLPESNRSRANAVSMDGQVVVGLSGGGAFRWTEREGMVALPGRTLFGATAVSADGRAVYGDEEGDEDVHVIRWDVDGRITRYPNPEGVSASFVRAVTTDGSIAVGEQHVKMAGGRLQMRAVVWYSPTNIVQLGFFRSGSYSKATAVNSDGTVIVGEADRAAVFRWTQATGMESLTEWIEKAGGSLPSSSPNSAQGVSGDGSKVVGGLQNGNPYVAFGPARVKNPGPQP